MLEKFLPSACLGAGGVWPSSAGDALGSIRRRIGDHAIRMDSEECDQTACVFTQHVWPEGALRQTSRESELSCGFLFQTKWLYLVICMCTAPYSKPTLLVSCCCGKQIATNSVA